MKCSAGLPLADTGSEANVARTCTRDKTNAGRAPRAAVSLASRYERER